MSSASGERGPRALALRYAARSDVGLRREGNEDAVYAGPRLLVVADGMGGHAAGEVASAVAVAHLARLDDDVPGSDLLDALDSAVRDANEQLAAMVAADGTLEGMGTTVTGLLVDRGRVALVHVGDSRAYLLRDGELSQLSRDHTFVQSLVEAGEIAPDEAESHPKRSLLLRAVDGRDDVQVDLSVRRAREGDRFLLCSDGLSGVVSAERLAKELTRGANPAAAVDRLVDLALRGGAPDNVTVLVADVVDAEAADVSRRPVVGGAATDALGREAEDALSRTDSPAVRAARAARAGSTATASPEGAPDGGPPGGGRRGVVGGVVRGAAGLLALSLVAVLLLGAGALWLRGQWYVGDSGGDVALFQGLSTSVAGLPLSRVAAVSELPVEALPSVFAQRVGEGIPADDRDDAVAIAERLATAARTACEARRRVAPAPAAGAGGCPSLGTLS